jgi:hypothetical protein
LDIYWNILTMHVPINVKSPNNISEWQMGLNSAFKGLTYRSSRRCMRFQVMVDTNDLEQLNTIV